MAKKTNYYFDDCRVYADAVPALVEAVAPPDNALWIAPPDDCPEGFAIVAREDRAGWDIVPDHRPTGAFSPDGQWHRVDFPGELPEGWTVDPPPPSPEDVLKAEIAELQARLDALDAEYLKPYTLANLALGDPEALERKAECDAAKAEIKAKLKKLTAPESQDGV